jgi:RNA polymerase sigma-70 factor (ECF subfamily)
VVSQRRPSALALPAARPTFDQVYAQELSYVWNSLRRLGVRIEDLEDLAHEVFIVVHRRLPDYDPTRPLHPWLFGIAFRVVSQRRRDDPPRSEVTSEGLQARPDSGPEAALAASEARRLVSETLQKLDIRQRAVLIMHDIDERSAPEIALALDVPLNTVYSRLRLARRKFLRFIGDAEGEES